MEGDKIEKTHTNNPPENKIAGEVTLLFFSSHLYILGRLRFCET